MSAPVWAYALLALLDVEANACLVAAYRWTSMTSVQLLDAWTIPAVLVLSAWVLKSVYGRHHYVGALLCVLGFGILVVFDARGGETGGQSGPWEGRKPWVGDALTILGATLYAASNVFQERLISHSTPTAELLGMLGVFGTAWSLVQGIITEGSAASGAHWTRLAVMLPFLGFGAAMFAFYSLVPIALRVHGAALLNLSLLAADAWTGLARGLFLEGFPAGALVPFLACFAITGLGIIVFVSGDAGIHVSHRMRGSHQDSQLNLGATTKQEQTAALQYVEEGLELEHCRSDSETQPLIAPAVDSGS